ncbi:unnamed protein product [Dibothriocephalus latus]|uniref:Uncharacterized protein n=1 Tax=Dibothriocephalus latus TaxID=60516 RepID=A0A3P7M7D0_DIBLA|nr:unnamed protein product [Dibothriocephalus latus]
MFFSPDLYEETGCSSTTTSGSAASAGSHHEHSGANRDLPIVNEQQALHTGAFNRPGVTSTESTPPLTLGRLVNAAGRTNLAGVGVSQGSAPAANPTPTANTSMFSRLNPERRTIHTANPQLLDLDPNFPDSAHDTTTVAARNISLPVSTSGAAGFFKSFKTKIGIG